MEEAATAGTDQVIEAPIEFEDIDLSDAEDTTDKELDAIQLTIDSNCRLVAKGSIACGNDARFCERESNYSTFHSFGKDLLGDTSSEDLDFSDDGATCSNEFKTINLDGIGCAGINQHFDSSSSFNRSSTVFKKNCLSDADEDINIFERRSMLPQDGRSKTLASGLTVTSVFASVKDFFSGKADYGTPMNITYPLSDAMLMKDNKPYMETPLMTCEEFLKGEISEGEGTDEEEISMDLLDARGIHHAHNTILSNGGACTLDDAIKCRVKGDFISLPENDTRRPSWTTELLSDDESTSVENKTDIVQSKTKKRKSCSNVFKDPAECLTDEEDFDVEDKEWTETDESGGVRQVTQIKTETSINFEGDDAVKSLRKIPEKEPSDAERKGSTDSEADDLSFTEKKSYFQRLSLTSDNVPGSNKYIQDTSFDDLPMAEGEIIEEKISFEDKLKMFEPDEDNRKKIQKRDKQEQPTVYRYDFTKNGNDRPDITEYAVSELEKAEEIVKQVSEELMEEENRLNSGKDDTESAITLEKVEQEVYSLVAEVDREEELSKERMFDAGIESASIERDPVLESPSDTQEISMLEDITEESKSVYSERILEQETLQLDVEEHETPAQGQPFEESSYSEATRVHLESERDFHKGRLSLELCKQDVLHEAIKLDEDDSLDLARHSTLPTTADSHIKSEILQEEIDQSIEESPLEVKHIVEELQEISASDDHKCDVYKQIRTEIFTQELGADIESGSPERKELGAFSSEKSDNLSDSDDDKPEGAQPVEHQKPDMPFTGIDKKDKFDSSKKSDELSDSDEDKPDDDKFGGHDSSKLNLLSYNKEKSNDMSKMSDNITDSDDDKPDSAEFMEHENSELPLSSTDNKEKLNDSLSIGFEKEGLRRGMSPQISEDSCVLTDEISSEGVLVEPDEQLFDYEEAKDEHSLTEQLQALASDSQNSAKKLIVDPLRSMEFGSHEFDNLSSGMSSSISDLEVHRRTKDITFSRHDKKEIRSLKSTKQVSTIEEHSSIESCDSPQDLMLQELPEKYDAKECSYNGDDSNQEFGGVEYSAKTSVNTISKNSISTDDFSSKDQGSSPENEKSNLPSGSESDIDPSFLPRLSDNSDKSPKISRSDSKSSHSKKSDSDAEGSKLDSVGEASGKKKEESYSSSGETESPYYSVETSDSGRTPRSTPAASRPCSSEFDINVFSGHGSEYETCVTSQGISGEGSGSYATAVSSQEISYATACSSFSHSSRESAYSVDSESSGHLASVEVSSEASETLVPPAIEMELEFSADLEMPVLDEEPAEEDSLKEPYDMDIPDDVIRGGIELPFMKNWDLNDPNSDTTEEMKQLPQQWSWQFATESEVPEKFEVLDSAEDASIESKSNVASIAEPQIEESSANNAKSVDTALHFAQVGTSYSYSGPSHRRSFSSVMDINLEKEPMEQNATIVDEEQLSASESSATHSEQTWQTSSIDTAVLLSSHAPTSTDGPNVMLDSFQETPPDKELTSELGYSSNIESSYLQLNGPVEVDYNPDYDNPDDGDSELTSNQIQSSMAYEIEGLQFDLEMEGSVSVSDAANNATGDTLDDLETNLNNISSVDEGNNQSTLDDHQATQSSDFELQNNISLDADQPEAQQEQSLSFRNYDHQESESFVCSDLTSYLPESDQADLLSGVVDSLPPSFESEINIPIAGSASSNEGSANVEARVNLMSDLASADSAEKVDMVDTSPEDDRYEYKSMKNLKSPKEENPDLNFSPSSHDDILNPESDYIPQNLNSAYDDVPGTELYTHQEEEEFDIRESYLSPIPSVEGDKGSTPSSYHSRRFFPRSGDTSAASSLQEFERLEADIATGRISRSSIDSAEKISVTKSGEHDDVSLTSLTEFEKIEKECVDNIPEHKTGIEDIMMLSEIEEGMESQCSDALEILQEGSEASEYERRRIDIEQVIKVAQCNVEKFQDETFSEGVTSDECTVLLRAASETQDISSEETKASSKEGGNTDFEESEQLALTLENDSTIGGHDSSSSGDKNCARIDCMISSTDSMDPSSSTATHATYQFETDSVMSSSLNSAQASGEECTMVSSTDTLEPEYKLTYSHGDSATEEKTQVSSRGDESIVHSKGALECKLKELQTTNGAKQQMEMFLSKLTDESVLMDDFTSHSFPDALEESELQSAPDDLLQSIEAAQGVSSSGDGSALDGDGLVSTTTSTTTRVVTSVISDPEGQSEFQSTFVQQLSDDDIRQSCEITVNEVLNDTSKESENDE